MKYVLAFTRKIILFNCFEFYLSRKLFFVLLNELTTVPALLNVGFLHGSILEFIFLFYVKMIFLKHCQKKAEIWMLPGISQEE